jgi:hypothetical protein
VLNLCEKKVKATYVQLSGYAGVYDLIWWQVRLEKQSCVNLRKTTMKKAKTDKGWAGHKLFGYTYSDRDIRTNEDKYQDAVLDNLEKKAKKPKRKKNARNKA